VYSIEEREINFGHIFTNGLGKNNNAESITKALITENLIVTGAQTYKHFYHLMKLYDCKSV
jgi:hypothetical protein